MKNVKNYINDRLVKKGYCVVWFENLSCIKVKFNKFELGTMMYNLEVLDNEENLYFDGVGGYALLEELIKLVVKEFNTKLMNEEGI